ncbi:DUF6199 family natural product biosynthesis protein [Kitasatospora sp. NPDC058263]
MFIVVACLVFAMGLVQVLRPQLVWGGEPAAPARVGERPR